MIFMHRVIVLALPSATALSYLSQTNDKAFLEREDNPGHLSPKGYSAQNVVLSFLRIQVSLGAVQRVPTFPSPGCVPVHRGLPPAAGMSPGALLTKRSKPAK